MTDQFLKTFQGADFTIMMNQAAQDISKSVPILDPRRHPSWPKAAAAVSNVPEPSDIPPWHVARAEARGSWSKPADESGKAVSFPAKPPSLGHVEGATIKAGVKRPATTEPNPTLPVAASGCQPAACPAKAAPKPAAKAAVAAAKSPEAPYQPIKEKLEEKDAEIAYLKRRLHNSQRGGRNKVYYKILATHGQQAADKFWNPPPAAGSSSSSSSKDQPK
jgi:hypothetical protein